MPKFSPMKVCFLSFWFCISSVYILFSQTPVEVARVTLQLATEGKTNELTGYFSSKMKKELSAAQMNQVMMYIGAQYGSYVSSEEPVAKAGKGSTVVTIPLKYEKGSLSYRVSINKKGEVVGLFFIPGTRNIDWKAPDYADSTAFTEDEIMVKTGGYELPGMYTYPKNREKFPVVILVHGSGPHDMDETIGASKVFKDIAWGLASQGIGVIRYIKRTNKYPEKSVPEGQYFTTYYETVEDALSAVDLARTLKGADPANIYVAGHSLGAMMAPEIARLAGEKVKGIVLLAGPARKLEDILVYQYNLLLGSGGITKEEAAIIKDVEKGAKLIKSGKYKDDVPAGKMLAYYGGAGWRYLSNYDQVETAKGLSCKILVIQGRRDYQVTMEDYQVWYREFFNRADFYVNDSNHLLVHGEGPSTPQEYEVPGHVEKGVIDHIVKWINK